MEPRVVVVGASLAGSRTIRALRRRSFGGEIVLIGDELDLPYDRPPLSKHFLADPEQTEPNYLEGPEFYDGVELRLGRRAIALNVSDRSVTLDDGAVVQGDHVVAATGAVPRSLPTLPKGERVATLRTVDDARRIRAALHSAHSLLIIGGGFIGCEVAAAARKHGVAVTMVEPMTAPVVRGIGAAVGSVIAELQRENGVDLRLETTILQVSETPEAVVAELSDGSTVRADFAVVGVGAVPATDWLEGSGVSLDNGVLCNARGSAVGGDGHVWAVGDVSAWPSTRYGYIRRVEHWTNATEQAGVVAAGIMGVAVDDHDPVPYVWSDQYQHKFQILGSVSGDDDTEVIRGDLADRRFVMAYSRAGRMTGIVACDMPVEVARMRPLLAESAPMPSVTR